MTIAKAVPREAFCPECGALNNGMQDRCWLCYRDLPLEAELVDAQRKSTFATATDTSRQPLLIGLAVGTLLLMVLVGIGAFASDQGLGIAYVLVITPSLLISLITFAISHRRHGANDASKSLNAGLKSFFISLGATVLLTITALALAVLIAVAAIIALIVKCFQALGGHP